MRRGGSILAVTLAIAGCVPLGRDVDPLTPAVDRDIGYPVMSFLWRKVVHDSSGSHLPQEFAVPAAHGDTLYVGSHAQMFYALRASDGKELWRRRVGATSGQPLVTETRIYLGTDDGTMLALDRDDGELRWRYQTKGAILHAPILVGDMVLFANEADHVYALDRDRGTWRWQYDRETPEEFTMRGHAGLATDGEHVFAGFADGHLVALGAQNGQVVWVRSLAGDAKQFVDVDATPVVEGGLVYCASVAGGLYAIDARDGTERWRLAVRGAGSVTPDGEQLYFAAADEGLYAADRNGHLLWRQGLRRGGDPARPLVWGDYLFLSLADRGLMVVDKRSGQLLQSFDPGPGVSARPEIQADRLFVISNGGILYAMAVTR